VNVVMNLILIPTLGLTGAGIALLSSEVTSIALTMFVYRGVAPLPRVQVPAKAALAVGAMLAATSVRLLVDSPFIGLVLAGLAGVTAYGATLLVLHAVPADLRAAVGGLLRISRPRSTA
jgi:O-antigen/teichoic acid export membrane protein